MGLPAAVLDLANRQHNVIGRRQALAHMDEGAYDGHLRRGRLQVLHRGVVAIAGGASPPQQRLMAAALRAGHGARITGPAVLGLFDVDGFTPRDPFTVLVPAGRRVSNVEFAVHVDPLPGVDEARFDEIPIARLPLAYLDAACHAEALGDRRLRVGLDSSCWKRLTTRRAVLERARELGPSHAGASWVLDLECGGGLRPESERERQVLAALTVVHPQPECQVWLHPTMRVDFLWRRLRVVGEYLGWVDHDVADAGDVERFARLEAMGYEVITIRAQDLVDADALAGRVQQVLVRRARELGVALA